MMTQRHEGSTAGKRVLLLTTSNSYRRQDFVDAAAHLGIETVIAMDTPQILADEWNFRLGVDFSQPQQAAEQLVQRLADLPLDAVLALDDSGATVAALVAARLGLAHNDPAAADAARNKFRMRKLLAACGASVPAFQQFRTDQPLHVLIAQAEEHVGYPCVVKPEDLNGSRGVIRADTPSELAAAVKRLTALIGVGQPFLIEGYIPGVEVALEGILSCAAHGPDPHMSGRSCLHVLALFDKPDPLEGPFFEETIYVTPSRLPPETQRAIIVATEIAAQGLGLQTGPLHAELRVNEAGPWIVEVAGRSIGGLCSRILRFGTEMGNSHSLEELILAHACGLPVLGQIAGRPMGDGAASLEQESQAGGVMMIPIADAGILRGVKGIAEAKAVPGIEDVQITVQINGSLVPLPEGDAYLGFIFARGPSPATVEEALRQAHGRLNLDIVPEFVLNG